MRQVIVRACIHPLARAHTHTHNAAAEQGKGTHQEVEPIYLMHSTQEAVDQARNKEQTNDEQVRVKLSVQSTYACTWCVRKLSRCLRALSRSRGALTHSPFLISFPDPLPDVCPPWWWGLCGCTRAPGAMGQAISNRPAYRPQHPHCYVSLWCQARGEINEASNPQDGSATHPFVTLGSHHFQVHSCTILLVHPARPAHPPLPALYRIRLLCGQARTSRTLVLPPMSSTKRRVTSVGKARAWQVPVP